MANNYVTVVPAFRGPTAGYQAVLVEAYDDPEFCLEPDITVLRRGPFSDAYLIARTAAIRWAHAINMPWRED